MTAMFGALLRASLFLCLLAACSRSIDSQLVTAAANGDVTLATRLIESGASVNANANDGWTPLTRAARNGHVEIVRFLIDHNANVNQLESGGNSPLYWAAYAGHTEVVRVLLAHGADAELRRDSSKELPLEVAMRKRFDDIVMLLEAR